ncbi:MAG: GAF domain-containing protein [Anaerolineales bacterium]|nr:GAF domain-containing protein [Anaerolineales bacterium]
MTTTRTSRFPEVLNKVLQIIVLAYQGVALMAFLVVPFLASRWLSQPFPGAFIEQTLMVNEIRPSDPAAWPLLVQVGGFGYQLTEIAGTPVSSSGDIRSVLDGFVAGETVAITVRTPEGGLETHAITLGRLPQADRMSFLYIPYVIGIIYMGMSLWIYGMRRTESAGRAFALFATSTALALGTLFDLWTTHSLSLFWTLSLAMAGGALIDLALAFPQEVRLVTRLPYLRWIGYLIALGLAGYAATTVYDLAHPLAYQMGWRWIFLFDGAAIIFFAGMLIYRSLGSSSPIVRTQARTILAGMLFSFLGIAVWFLVSPGQEYPLNPYLTLLPLSLFPFVTGYTILRYRIIHTDYLVRRGVLYATLTILAVGGYALLVSALSLIFGESLRANSPLLIGLIVFVLAVALNPFRNRLQQAIDAVFFRGEAAYQQRVENVTRELTNIINLGSILHILREHITSSLLPTQLHIFIYDPLNDQYGASYGESEQPTSDLLFTAGSALVQTLSRERLPLFFDPLIAPANLAPDLPRLTLLGARLFVPLPGGERLLGWLALGPRRSGENYSSQDIKFLDLIGRQAAIAIDRAQVIFNLERRVREMNILSRVASGVNVTVTFDDVLELIFAQTDQVLPVDDLHITLHNKENDFFFYAFCLEQDDRVPGRENLPMPPTVGLNPEVIRGRRAILTNDYARECQKRGVSAANEGIFAWMSVPMNAGAETIGALSIGSRDPSVSYTPGQQELLQAIAEQAAGAIVKARLLQESERRTRQLTYLNEITRQLTGTLETEPLLHNILESAIAILNCEAGTLFMVDEQTDELVFTVVISPVAEDLIGSRLAPGTGIVGEAVQTRRPVISNNVLNNQSWSASTDEKTGFVTKNLLAVPLQVKERVIGVLEVINRKDNLPFEEEDQNLLQAFASQAAVAIENARLYTLTDQELNARVEELSVMQRIDRELNASLEVERAMRITLDWAMRQSAADAGLIGVTEERGLRLMAQQGYDALVETYKDQPLPLEQTALRTAVDTGQPQQVVLEENQRGLLAEARSQIVIPIRREASVIGLILVESISPDSQPANALAFMTRLSDHAAIAIANAQLYNEVQSANVAKSEFVSFVAHELKNPMTSIKGYTDLLAKGAVGEINDMQSNFLGTILSNVERMATLVTDLNDNSKIEAGVLRLEFKGVELATAIDEVVRSVRRQMDEKKQAVNIKLSKDLPRIWADPIRLAQILTNFVSNAHKYTPEGGIITIGAEQASNQWDPDGAEQVAHIWVQDNGIGISLEDQHKIFQKFFRSDDQKAREAPGTGLGLNITKSLIEMMGGTVWFESEFRLGTTFHFTVPVAEEE